MSENGQRDDQGQAGKRKLRSMFNDTIYITFGSVTTQIFSFLILTVLSRKLSLDTFGVYRVLLAIYATGTIVLSLGIQPIIQRYLPELLAKADKRSAVRLEWLGALVHGAAAVLIALACWIFQGPLGTWLNTDNLGQLLPYLFLFTLFKFEAAVFEEMLTAHRSQLFRNSMLAGFQGLKFVLFVFLLPQDGSAQTVMGYLILSNIVLLGAYVFRVLGLNKKISNHDAVGLPWRRMIRFGLLRYVTAATFLGFSDAVIGIVSNQGGTEAAGLFGFALQIIVHLGSSTPVNSLIAVIVPVYVREYTLRKDTDQLIKVFRIFNKIVTVILAPILVGSCLLFEPITREVFDPQFLPAATTFRILFAGMFVFYFLNTSSFLLVILEKPEITLYSRVFVVYNVVMLYLLMPRYGIEGAAVATSTAYAFGYIFTYLMVKRIIPIRIPWLATFRTFLYTGIMALAVWPLMNRIDSLISLLLVVLLGAVVYTLLAWRLPVFDQAERESLNTAVGRRIFPL